MHAAPLQTHPAIPRRTVRSSRDPLRASGRAARREGLPGRWWQWACSRRTRTRPSQSGLPPESHRELRRRCSPSCPPQSKSPPLPSQDYDSTSERPTIFHPLGPPARKCSNQWAQRHSLIAWRRRRRNCTQASDQTATCWERAPLKTSASSTTATPEPCWASFYRRTADPEITADLTAETFAQAFLARGRYRERGLRSSWVASGFRQPPHQQKSEAPPRRGQGSPTAGNGAGGGRRRVLRANRGADRLRPDSGGGSPGNGFHVAEAGPGPSSPGGSGAALRRGR